MTPTTPKPDERSAGAPPPWHALLAPLPAGAVPRRTPVAGPEVLATPAGAAIAGWEQLVLDLSAGTAGLRVLLVLLDKTGQPISASDSVLHWCPGARAGEPAQIRHESIGGRFESGGTFSGTHWSALSTEPADGEDPQWEMTPRKPTERETAALRALVAELLERQPPR